VRLAFESCVFDSDTREVRRAGRPLALSPKAFELLELLIRERPKALSKERIHSAVWPKTFVSDASLSNLIAELRAVLGDDAQHPRVLRTIPRFGYAFVAKVPRSAPDLERSAAYRILWESREIDLGPGENVLGRDHDAAVWIDDASVSRHHARIDVGADGATLEDLGSKNGTLLNREMLESPTKLADGDEIRIGRAVMAFRVLRQAGSTETVTGMKRATRPRER